MNLIKQWLSSADKDFKKGVALYATYGDNASLKEVFKKGFAPYDINKKLLESLSAVQNKSWIPEFTAKAIVTTGTAVKSQKQIEIIKQQAKSKYNIHQLINKESDECKSLEQQISELFLQRTMRSNLLTNKSLPLGEACLLIDECDYLTEQMAELHYKKEYFIEHGEFQKEAFSNETVIQNIHSQEELIKERLNCNGRKSKAKKALKKYPEKRIYYTDKIALENRILQEIKEQLDFVRNNLKNE